MDAVSILSLMFGGSPEYGLRRQLTSSSCFTNDDALYGYEEDQGNNQEQKAPIKGDEIEDEPSTVN